MSARAMVRRAVEVAAWGWTAVVTLALTGITIAWFSGQELRTVESASMAPTVPEGSLAVLEPVRESDLAVGDVVEFTDPVDASRTVLHRVEAISSPRGSGRYLRTRGDANATSDPVLVPVSSVHARLTHRVPHVGTLIWALRPPAGFVILTGAPLALFLLSRWTERRHVVDASDEDDTLQREVRIDPASSAASQTAPSSSAGAQSDFSAFRHRRSMTTTPVPVTPAATDDAVLIGRVLADAFHDDPVGRWLDPDGTTRAVRLERFFELWASAFTVPHGEVLRVGEAGAALWLPPGRWQIPPLVLLRHLPRLGHIFGRRTALLLRGQRRLERHHPRASHWYLPAIGVATSDQGRGVGSALLGAVLERCDRDGAPAYLEATCERNRELYARHGFERCDDVIHLPDGPPLWPMWREPRQAGR